MNAPGGNPLVTHCVTGGTTQPTNDDSFQQRAVAAELGEIEFTATVASARVGIEDGILATNTGHGQLSEIVPDELLVKSSQTVTTSKEQKMNTQKCFGVKAVTVLVLTLAGPSTKLTISAAETHPTLRVTPCARATPEQIKVPGREPSQFKCEQSLFVEWSKIPNILFKTNFPESIISLRRLGGWICLCPGIAV